VWARPITPATSHQPPASCSFLGRFSATKTRRTAQYLRRSKVEERHGQHREKRFFLGLGTMPNFGICLRNKSSSPAGMIYNSFTQTGPTPDCLRFCYCSAHSSMVWFLF
jgi:hypothetical protein